MPSTALPTPAQRVLLAGLLQSRLTALRALRASQLQSLSQVESARQTLLQDADDATQRAGAHEVEGTVGDIESAEFQAISDALQRIHRADYGVCIDCHVAIPFARLRLEPQVLRCAACQTLHERNTPP